MTTTPPLERTIRTDADLFELWTTLMGPGGFGRRSLWLVFLGPNGTPLPVVVPIDDIPEEPDALIHNVAGIVDGLIADGSAAAVAVLLSRPGPGAMTASDRRWARAIRGALSPALRRWPIHLATYERLQVFAPDDLLATS